MDLNGLLRLIFLEKSDLTVGVLIGLTLLVVVLMLVRSVMEEKQASATGSGAAVDAKALSLAVEGALKKVLADKPPVKTSDAGQDGEAAVADVTELTKTLSAREAKIASLMSDLETVKAQVEGKTGAASAGGADNSADLLALQEKVKELQAKLSEYEIIEDDIADLSIFKEENKKLKDEIEKLRAAAQTAQAQVQSAQASVAAPTPSAETVQAAQSAISDVPKETAAPRAAAEPFKLDTDDDVMGEFAKALSADKPLAAPVEPAVSSSIEPAVLAAESATTEISESDSDPFGPLDTDKMLAEVSSMGDGGEVSTSVLEDELDTDRLMAEMGMGEPVTPSAEPDFAAPVVAETQVAADPVVAKPAVKPVVVEAPEPSQDDVPVDDLLAEFKDTDYPTLKGTKGS